LADLRHRHVELRRAPPPPAPKETLRQEIGDKILITYVGRLIYGKGVIHLLEALASLKRQDALLLIIGDGPEMMNLQGYARENSLSNQVRFLGNTLFDELVSTLKVTDIFVNPSYNEGLPTSILEAGVCRRAIIATSVGGTLEIITPEQSGIIINPYSTKELKNALKKLLDNSELRKRLGENARIEIEQKFNWGDTVSSYLKEIELIRRKI
jgi:glycosyltransferase involved in cell wall biosynthesis